MADRAFYYKHSVEENFDDESFATYELSRVDYNEDYWASITLHVEGSDVNSFTYDQFNELMGALRGRLFETCT